MHSIFNIMTKFIFLNNKIIPDTDAGISSGDRGFLYGDSIFETFRSYDGVSFKLTEHIERMRQSAKWLKISFKYTNTEISKIIEELIDKNNNRNAYIRITLSRGEGGSALQMNDNINPTILIHVKPYTPYDRKLYENGMYLVVSNYRRSTTNPIHCHKSTNLLTSILLKEEANKKSADEAIILNTDGYVAECIVSNIFMVSGESVITPSLDTNILPGITRRTVLDICNDSSIPVNEEHFTVETMLRADEVFITNSLMEIMPVSKIEDSKIGRRTPGKITQQLMSAYKHLI